MESTYGGSNDFQPARSDAEAKLYETINTVLTRGGKVIIPAILSRSFTGSDAGP